MALPETESPPDSAASAAAEDVTSKAERTTRPIMRASLSSISLAARRNLQVAIRWQPVRGDSECMRSFTRLDVSLRCGLSTRRHRPEVCSGGWQRKTSHVLRDAHAYMLISIPTATSTIFGAFQVMFSSFQVGGVDACVFPPLHVLRGGRI